MPVMTSFRDYIASRKAAEPSAEPIKVATSPLDRALTITFFADHFTRTKSQETISLRSLVDRLKTTRAATKSALPWLKLAAFGDKKTEKGSLRHDENVVEISGIEADYDGEKITLERAKTVLTGAGIAAILYTSPSHTEDTPRWRILCPTSEQLSPSDRFRLVGRINGLFVGALAGESFTLSQSYFFGSIADNPSHEVVVVEGKAIDIATELDASAIGKPAKPEPIARAPQDRPARTLQNGGSAYGLSALERECDAIRSAPDGTKHATLNKAAFSIGGLVTAGALQRGTANAELTAALESILPYCKDQKHARNTLSRAFEDGMGQPRDIPELPPQPVDEVHPAAELIAKMQANVAKRAAVPVPVSSDLMDVGGTLKLFIDYCEATAFSSQPFLALGAGICALGAVAGRRYRTRTDLRTNFYAIGLADSGGGKDHARGVVKKVVYGANLGDFLGGSKIASGSGLLSALARHPSMLFQIDEMGLWLQNVLGKSASSHQREIWANMMELFTSANLPFGGTEYANQKENARVVLHQPNACVWGTSVPNEFWKSLETGAMQNGSMARFLVFLSPCNYPDTPLPDVSPVPNALIDAFKAVAAGVPGHDYGGNLAATMAAGVDIEPYVVPETKDAYARLMTLKAEELAWKRKAEGTYATAQIARMFENAYKLALLRAISNKPSSPTITATDVEWGAKLARHCINTLLREAGRFVADNEYEAKMNKALDIIRRFGPISGSDMVRRGFKFPERDRTEILRTLETSGQIQTIEQTAGAKGGRPTTRYTASFSDTSLECKNLDEDGFCDE